MLASISSLHGSSTFFSTLTNENAKSGPDQDVVYSNLRMN